MTFLALTTFQAVTLTLLTAGAIIAFYLIKLRRRRVAISSSLVWRKVLDKQLSHSLVENLRSVVSIIVAVTIGVLLALSLARPEIESLTGKRERIAIVLDTSPTMMTLMSDGRTRWQHGLDEAGSLLALGGPTTEFRVVDTSGATDSAFTSDRSEIRSLLGNLRPRTADFRFPGADAPGVQVYFISDGVSDLQPPAAVKRIVVFEPAENVGITAFQIRPMPSTPQGYEAYLEIQNRGDLATAVEMQITGTGKQKIAKPARLAPGQTSQEVFNLTNFDGGGIRATVISKGDEFVLDDQAFAYLPVRRKTRTLLVTNGNPYLLTLLKSDANVELTVSNPGGYRESPDFDAYIFDRFAPPQAPARPSLVIGTPNAPWLPQSKGVLEKPVITAWRQDHPIMQYATIHDVSIQRAAKIDATNLVVIAASNESPLIVASTKPKWVMLAFDLGASDLPLQTGFPVFVDNALAWFSRDSVALSRKPGLVSVPLANADIRTIDGMTVPSHQVLGETVFDAPEPGLFVASQEGNRLHVAVNLSNPAFSDVNHSSWNEQGDAASSAPMFKHELWFYMVFLALLLIGVEWFTYHRRLTL